MNLAAMRRENVYKKWVAASRANQYNSPDQDLLNDMCRGRILFLPQKYNISPAMLIKLYGRPQFARELYDLRYNTVMLHFYVMTKPWEKTGHQSRFAHIWWKFARETGLF